MAEEAEAFRKTLNRHGYPFHAAVIKRVLDLGKTGSPWRIKTSEFPVSVKGKDTRIDIVLSRKAEFETGGPPAFLICECKRANPSLRNWCFCRLPFVHRRRNPETLLVESVWHEKGSAHTFSRGIKMDLIPDQAYHIGIEFRPQPKNENSKGDSGNGRGQIEDTATQVCRGLNGFLDYMEHQTRIDTPPFDAVVIPVIITTARLFTCSADLGEADLSTGELSTCELTETDRVYYQYHVSPSLRHKINYVPDLLDLAYAVDQEFARTIVIVNAAGLQRLLTKPFAHDKRD